MSPVSTIPPPQQRPSPPDRPRHCRPSSADDIRWNRGIHSDLFRNTILGSTETDLNGFLSSDSYLADLHV
ncbi:hypothetical protein JHK82_017683 [Glycine max]|nr:hypothetical protein JHK82_017683 [Glycine max]KAH1085649.1 hypothetical protein GYH30_017558 [Glycine max]